MKRFLRLEFTQERLRNWRKELKLAVGTSALERTQIRQDEMIQPCPTMIIQVTEQALKRAGLKEKYDKLRDQFGDMVMIP